MTTDESVPRALDEMSPSSQREHEQVSAEDRVGVEGTLAWWKMHLWPVVGALALLIFGMLYSFFWYPVVHHIPFWVTPGDIWDTFRDAHYVIWNGEGRVYNASTDFVTFPGIALFLAPFAWLQDALKLTVSAPGLYLSKPTGWFVLDPVNLLCGGFLLFPLDALARRLSLSTLRRALATFLEAVLIFQVVAIWGHPEDTLAIGLGIYALLAAYDRRWLHSAAFFALAIVFQPLTLLIVPIALAYVPFRRWPTFGVVMSIPTVALLIPPLVQDWGPTTYAIFKQPNFPSIDHPTPWMSLAPVLTRAGWVKIWEIHNSVQEHKVIYGPVRVWAGEIVAAGPGRTIALVLACLAGVWVALRKPPLVEVIWWAALSLSLRCVFESVMDPYYLVPALVLIVVVASSVGWFRFIVTLAAAAFCTRTSYWHTGEWRYYLLVILPLLSALAIAWPGRHSSAHEEYSSVKPREPASSST